MVQQRELPKDEGRRVRLGRLWAVCDRMGWGGKDLERITGRAASTVRAWRNGGQNVPEVVVRLLELEADRVETEEAKA